MSGNACWHHVDAVAVHGFPLDWNHWSIHEWPDKLAEIQAVTDLPVWVSEVGVSTFRSGRGAGVRIEANGGTADRARGTNSLVQSLRSARAWPATTRHREAEGSSYYRHFYMGLLQRRWDAQAALQQFADYTPEFGICQWFHFEDHRLDELRLLAEELGVGISAPV